MIRVAPLLVVAGFILLAACKKDDDTATSDSTANGSTRSVKCSKSTCTNDDYCCGSDGWADANCSVTCEGTHAIYCDDASDCQTGAVCCFLSEGNNITGASCLDACPTSPGHGQLCKAGSTECASPTSCAPLGLAPGGLSACQ